MPTNEFLPHLLHSKVLLLGKEAAHVLNLHKRMMAGRFAYVKAQHIKFIWVVTIAPRTDVCTREFSV